MRAIVTGGAGFIGSHLVELLLAKGWEVEVVDNLSTGSAANLSDCQERLSVHRMSVDWYVRYYAQRKKPRTIPHVIFHLAATVGVQRVLESPLQCLLNNFNETCGICEWAHGQTTPRLVFTSSSEVYGDSDDLPYREDGRRVLGPTTIPRWAYSTSKAFDEHLLLAYHQEHGLPVSIARLFNCVGPRQRPDFGMVLPRFIKAALANEPIEVYGDGQQTRTFCDVRDTIQALYLLATDERTVGNVYNVGSEYSVSILELAETVKRVLNSTSPIAFVDYQTAYGPRFQDTRKRVPDLTKIRALGWQPTYALEQTILDTAARMRGAADGI